MGRQVNFYMLPQDLTDYEIVLRQDHETRFLPERMIAPQAAIRNSLAISDVEAKWLGLYLTRASDLADLVFHHIPAQGYWTIDLSHSSAVEFDRCYYDGTVIGRGRLYFQPDFYIDGRRVEKAQEFTRWADGLLRWIRRHYRREPQSGFYVGPHAWEWVVHEGGKLRP